MTKDDLNSILNKLNKAKIGGQRGSAPNGLGTSLSLSSNVDFGIPSRIPELDLSIGRPGWPSGRVIEFYGLSMSGKTTAAYHALASCQRMGGIPVFIDTERSFDKARASQCGVDPEHLLILEAYDIEEIFEKIEVVLEEREVKDKKPCLICVDSITAVETRFDSERKLDEGGRVGEDARAIRRGLKKLVSRITDTNTTIIFINHATALIGKTFGKLTDSAGGNALKFYSALRIEFQFISNIYDGTKGEDRTRRGQMVALTTIKNKVHGTGAPVVQLELTENGFDMYSGLFEAFQVIGAMDKINNMNYHFIPTETTLMKKDWKKFVDTYETKDGKVMGLDGFYDYFLKLAQNDNYIEPYTTL